MKKTVLFALGLGLLAGQALAANPAPIARMTQMGATVLKQYPPVGGLTGWMMQSQGQQQLFYTTADGRYLLHGTLYDSQGRPTGPSQSQVASQDAVLTPAAQTGRDLDAVYATVASYGGIVEGRGIPLYVFFDPNCPYCHKLWRALRPRLDRFEVHWLPVNVLNPATGSAKMAGVFAARDKAAALGRMFEQSVSGSGSNRQAEVAMSYNVLALDKTGQHAVPTLLYKASGKANMVVGLPDEGTLDVLAGVH